MKAYPAFTFLLVVLLSACGTVEVSIEQPTSAETFSMPTATPTVIAPTPTRSEGRAMVAYTKDGDVLIWEETTGQSKTVFASGDVTRVAINDDGQVIAFVRQSESGVTLWAVDWNGRNPRELVSADTFRARFERMQLDYHPAGVAIGELEWIPGTHRLVYNWTFQIGSGDHLASPDLYLLDADILSDTLLAQGVVIDSARQLDIVPSPDGQELALITSTGLSFLNVDRSHRRDNVLTYSAVGASSSPLLMSTGVWTQDSRYFLITGSLEMDAGLNVSFSVWRVPLDGSSAEQLTPRLNGRPDSVTFSPDGKQIAYRQDSEGSLIAPLTREVGPVASDFKVEPKRYADLHWSPAGDAFTKDLLQLCSDASRDSDLCQTPFNTHAEGVQAVQWLDGVRVMFLTNAPCVLFLSSRNSQPLLIDFAHSFDGVLVEQE